MAIVSIDGSYGEGGGQILRTSLALSILTQRPVRIYNIRAGRKGPRMRPQHLASVEAAALICGGTVTGAAPNSDELLFQPGPIQSRSYQVDVGAKTGSAGSVSLIFQTIVLPLGFGQGSTRLKLKGGTHVSWSPPAEYIRDVFLQAVGRMGVQVHAEISGCGFYPIGGGLMQVTVNPCRQPLAALRIETRGKLLRLEVDSQVANLPLSIGERQLKQAISRLADDGLTCEGSSRAVRSPGKGTCCFLKATFEHVTAGFSALGALGKRAEQVADEAVEAFSRYMTRSGALDPYLADQLVPFLGIAEGESIVTLSEVTKHLKTNIWVVEQFLPVSFRLDDDPGAKRAVLRVRGAGTQMASA